MTYGRLQGRSQLKIGLLFLCKASCNNWVCVNELSLESLGHSHAGLHSITINGDYPFFQPFQPKDGSSVTLQHVIATGNLQVCFVSQIFTVGRAV